MSDQVETRTTKLMDRVLKLVALVLIATIVLLVIAPQFDLVTAATRSHRAASLLAVAVAILAAGLLACPIAHATSVERDPLFRSAAILDLNCVRLC